MASILPAVSSGHKNDFFSRINAIRPITSFFQKFLFTEAQITSIIPPVPAYLRGAFAIVTDAGRGMRWTQGVPKRGRFLADAKSRGPDTLTLVSSWRRQTAGDGGNRARLTGEITYKRETIARGMPGRSGEPW